MTDSTFLLKLSIAVAMVLLLAIFYCSGARLQNCLSTLTRLLRTLIVKYLTFFSSFRTLFCHIN